MATNENRVTNLNVFTAPLGTQRGNIRGINLLFLEKPYYARALRTASSFYKEALLAMGTFIRKKEITNIDKWDTEHIFYNPLLINENGKPFVLTRYFDDKKLYTLGQIFEENDKRRMQLPYEHWLNSLGTFTLNLHLELMNSS